MRSTFARTVALGATLGVLTGCGTLSVEEEKAHGRAAQREARQVFQLLRDPVTLRYIRDLGQGLVEAAEPSPFEFRFYVVEDDDLNALAAPGGSIYIFTGIIEASQDVSELAGVIAHEIGHVTSRHYAERYKAQRNTGILTWLLGNIIYVSTGIPAAANAPGVVAGLVTASYSRDNEREADATAIPTMLAAGYDPNGFVTFMETMQREHAGGFRLPQFMLTHPVEEERVANARALVAQHSPLPDHVRRTDGGRLEIIQQRLSLIIGTDIEDYLDEDEEEEEDGEYDDEEGEDPEREDEAEPDAEP